MNKANLLKAIAETAYNVGYAAKVNFATLDIVEKLPGLLGFISLIVGILSLYLDAFATKNVGAAMSVIGIASLYVALYQGDKASYDSTGKALTNHFNELKNLYFTVKSRADSDDVSDLIQKHEIIQKNTVDISVSKQILFSDWYAHYKFFWQQQIDWIAEQKNFSFWRDKIPLTAWISLIVMVVFGGYLLFNKMPLISCLTISGSH